MDQTFEGDCSEMAKCIRVSFQFEILNGHLMEQDFHLKQKGSAETWL